MDFYVLSRMFRGFKNVPGKYSKPPKYIIGYFGDYHSSLYRRILEKIGFTRVFFKEEKKGQCVDLTTRLEYPIWDKEKYSL